MALLMALICGPISIVVMVAVSLLVKEIPLKSHNPFDNDETLWIKFAGAASLAIMVWIADRLGKYFNVPPHRFAGPVAFSCATGIVVLVAILMMLGQV